jgi:hypothetical protein
MLDGGISELVDLPVLRTIGPRGAGVFESSSWTERAAMAAEGEESNLGTLEPIKVNRQLKWY